MIHVGIEVLIGSHLEQMEIWENLRQSSTSTQVCSESIDLSGFFWLPKCLPLALVFFILLGLALDFFLTLVISLFLILETLHGLNPSLSTAFIWLKLFHHTIGGCGRFMETTPDGLRLVHERVFLRYMHPVDNILLRNNIFVLLCQLEHLVGEALLRCLFLLQIWYMWLVIQEFAKHLWISSDVVDVRRKLRLLFIQEFKGHILPFSISQR